MVNNELEAKIELVKGQLGEEEEKYLNALKLRKDYNTLRGPRENIRNLKKELQDLYNSIRK